MPKLPKPALRGSAYDEYICIRNFMSAEGGMGLSGVKAQIYALIYSHSPADTLADDTGCYFGSIDYTAARIGAGRSTTIESLKWLLKNGLILEKGEHVQGDSSTTKKYVANRERAIAAQQQFKDYWDTRNDDLPRPISVPENQTVSEFSVPRPETAPEELPVENSDFPRPETVPDHSGSRPETVPENQPVSEFSASRPETAPEGFPVKDGGSSRPETVPENSAPRPETAPDHVQKPYPIKRGYMPLRSSSSSCPNSSSLPTSPKPNAKGMGGGDVHREIGQDLEPELLASLNSLMLRSLNQRAPFAEVLPAYRDALAKGYTPEQIDRGYTAYVARYREQHPGDPSYAIRLSNYLLRGDGLSIDEPKPERSAQAIRAERRALMQRLSNAGNPDFRAYYDAIPTDEEVARGGATKSEQQVARARLNDFLDYRQGKPGTAHESRIKLMLKGELGNKHAEDPREA